MDGPNFDPVVGEEVRVLGHPGLFKIVMVHDPIWKQPPDDQHFATSETGCTVDLERIGGNSVVGGVSWASLTFDETRYVRRTIEWLKTSPNGKKYPSYIVDYEITTENDHAGNPSIYVRFLVDPDYFFKNGKASEEKVAALNAFLYDVRQTLLGLGLDRWTYVRAGQARKVLDVAS